MTNSIGFEPLKAPDISFDFSNAIQHSEIHDLLDWIELSAIFDDYQVFRIDQLWNIFEIQWDNADDQAGNADKDVIHDELVAIIESEIDTRIKACNGNYPFRLSDDAEEVYYCPDTTDYSYVYVACLFGSAYAFDMHFNFECVKNTAIIQQFRNYVFQDISTIAVAGDINGSAVRMGWPRESKESIQEVLTRAIKNGCGIGIKTEPGLYDNSKSKDGGIDVIGWKNRLQARPSQFVYVQVASGKNWRDKPAKPDANKFEALFLSDPPQSNVRYLTVVPHHIHDEEHKMASIDHADILMRYDLASAFPKAFDLTEEYIDSLDKCSDIEKWVIEFQSLRFAA